MITAYTNVTDFGREFTLVFIERHDGEDFALVRHDTDEMMYPALKRVPIKEGERLSKEHYFLQINHSVGAEMMRALVVELARTGYILGDSNGLQKNEMQKHLETLKEENDRKHALMQRMLNIVEKA